VAIGPDTTATGQSSVAIGDTAQASQAGAIAIGLNSASTGTNTIAIGTGARATNSVAVGAGAFASNGGAAYGDNASASGSLATAIGPGASATHAGSVALGAGSVSSGANTVSFGAAGAERRLTNVAPAQSRTDAAQWGQVQDRFNQVNNQFNRSRIEARAGIAAVASMANAPMPSRPGALTLSMNAATYRGEAGLGASIAYRLPTSMPLMLTGGLGTGFRDDFVGRVGFAIELGGN
jgi:autotransporter adhesin